jgi:hypothetical protein
MSAAGREGAKARDMPIASQNPANDFRGAFKSLRHFHALFAIG